MFVVATTATIQSIKVSHAACSIYQSINQCLELFLNDIVIKMVLTEKLPAKIYICIGVRENLQPINMTFRTSFRRIAKKPTNSTSMVSDIQYCVINSGAETEKD